MQNESEGVEERGHKVVVGLKEEKKTKEYLVGRKPGERRRQRKGDWSEDGDRGMMRAGRK